MRRATIQKIGRVVVLSTLAAALITPATNATEPATDAALRAYIGLAGQRLIDDLGEPLLRTPHELWYSNGPSIAGGHPGAPNPAVVSGRNGVTVSGAGGDYLPPYFSRDACNVLVKLEPTGLIEAVESQGPGCFEFIHLLLQRHAGGSSPP